MQATAATSAIQTAKLNTVIIEGPTIEFIKIAILLTQMLDMLMAFKK